MMDAPGRKSRVNGSQKSVPDDGRISDFVEVES